MSRLVELKMTKCTLYLTEAEIIKSLPEEIFILGLQRGKAFKRAAQRREAVDKKYHTSESACIYSRADREW